MSLCLGLAIKFSSDGVRDLSGITHHQIAELKLESTSTQDSVATSCM